MDDFGVCVLMKSTSGSVNQYLCIFLSLATVHNHWLAFSLSLYPQIQNGFARTSCQCQKQQFQLPYEMWLICISDRCLWNKKIKDEIRRQQFSLFRWNFTLTLIWGRLIRHCKNVIWFHCQSLNLKLIPVQLEGKKSQHFNVMSRKWWFLKHLDIVQSTIKIKKKKKMMLFVDIFWSAAADCVSKAEKIK